MALEGANPDASRHDAPLRIAAFLHDRRSAEAFAAVTTAGRAGGTPTPAVPREYSEFALIRSHKQLTRSTQCEYSEPPIRSHLHRTQVFPHVFTVSRPMVWLPRALPRGGPVLFTQHLVYLCEYQSPSADELAPAHYGARHWRPLLWRSISMHAMPFVTVLSG
jgi:hypothetical protein